MGEHSLDCYRGSPHSGVGGGDNHEALICRQGNANTQKASREAMETYCRPLTM